MNLLKNKTLYLFTFLLIYSANLSAQDYVVQPVSNFVQTYKDKHGIILSAIEARTDLTIAQKLMLYESEITKIKDEFRANRRAEYQSKSVELAVEHSCTSKSSGGKKNCKYKCVYTPESNMYTRTDWIRVEGTNKGTSVSADGSSACLKMTVAGKGENRGTLYATFRYNPESISKLLDSDTVELFNQVIRL